jgi:hypothetical protein
MGNMYGKGDKAKATKLHSVLIRSLGKCESCSHTCDCMDMFKHDKYCSLQAAHIEGRKASATRTLLINAYCLCASCHGRYTDKPLTFSRFVTTTWAQEYRDELLRLSNTMTKVNWTDRYAELKQYKVELQNGTTLAELRRREAENL